MPTSFDPTAQFYSTLSNAFDFFNERLFDRELPKVIFVMQRKKSCFGHFSPCRWESTTKKNCDEISINPTYFTSSSLLGLLGTLAHELAHSWQHNMGKPGRRGYHNVQWADKMESIGLMPSDTGKEGGARTGERMTHYIIPNGKFILAAGDLVSSGFLLPWLDRFGKNRSIYIPPPSDCSQDDSVANQDVVTISSLDTSCGRVIKFHTGLCWRLHSSVIQISF